MRRIQHIFIGFAWGLIGLYLLIIIFINIPSFQAYIGGKIGQTLGEKLGTKVQVGKVDLGLFNRIIIDDVLIYDQSQRKMLQASRIATKLDIIPLVTKGRISVSSAQLLGLRAHFFKKDKDADLNFKFVVDSLASKDSKEKTPLDISIQSLIIRNGMISYHQQDTQETPNRFNPHHLQISDLSTHIALHKLTDEELSLDIKKLSFNEKSGLSVRQLNGVLHADKDKADVKQFSIELPHTKIRIPNASALFKDHGKLNKHSSIKYQVIIDESTITPCDIACFIPEVSSFKDALSVKAFVAGSDNNIDVKSFRVNSQTGSLGAMGSLHLDDFTNQLKWQAQISEFKITNEGKRYIERNLKGCNVRIPKEVVQLGDIRFIGSLHGGDGKYSLNGYFNTDAGKADINILLNGKHFTTSIMSPGVNIARITDNTQFGMASGNIKAEGEYKEGNTPLPFSKLNAKGFISRLDYNGYQYHSIDIDSKYIPGSLDGHLTINDPNGFIDLDGTLSYTAKEPQIRMMATVKNFKPRAFRLTDEFGDGLLSFQAKGDFTGTSIEHSNGFLEINDFQLNGHGKDELRFDHLQLNTGYQNSEHFIDVQSDFGNILIRGQYHYETLPQSFINLLSNKLPTLPFLPQSTKQSHNDFAIIANIHDAKPLQSLFGIPLQLTQPLHVKGVVNDQSHDVELDIDIPEITYEESHFKDVHAYLTTRQDTLFTTANINKVGDDGSKLSVKIDGQAIDNKLLTSIIWDAHNDKSLRGSINAETEFFKTEGNHDAAHMRIHPSEIFVDEVRWEVQPADIIYSKGYLNIDHFQVSNEKQHIIISGLATDNPEDSVNVDLRDIDVAYILNLVDFHSVDFSGLASGRATVKDIFGSLKASSQLNVNDFRFENGRMGTLFANADYTIEEGQVNIHAIANDKPYGKTFIDGYVSPKKNYIDIGIRAQNTRLEFVHSFCSSFMDNIQATGNGQCRVFGDLGSINLEGLLVANGDIDITTLNTTYTLYNDTIKMVPNEIIFRNDSIYDKNHQTAVVSGGLHHNNLKNLTFDIDIDAQNFLSYDFRDYGTQVFFGTVNATGNCSIKGRPGEITFDITATPEKGSFIEYNAAGPESISTGDFIHWRSANNSTDTKNENADSFSTDERLLSSLDFRPTDIPSDIRLNFLINTTPDFTLRVLMDEATDDKISLNGEGVIRANYFNKGSFDMFGNYLIDHGTYTMTIQNVIKKDFLFQPGSSIIFGGDPFNAALNLKGQYIVPAVSLSDLQMGRSFTQNNIRVNCLMNIEGTAGNPSVSFGLDMPTLSTDAQQMVRSVINSEEDMNQQVLYLLAVGRFLPQTSNNASQENTEQQNQTSLAMQSLLSGTLSQQINTILSNVVKSNNWNFGANISTGDEGFSNAEYEGLLSGRLLNNRLLINGEFGYRDNVNTGNGSSFIGDFDVQYLLYPNGNLAIKVYNETNDRYFTRNSLTTQGIGIIMKKDFSNLKDLFTKRKSLKKEKKQKKKAMR